MLTGTEAYVVEADVVEADTRAPPAEALCSMWAPHAPLSADSRVVEARGAAEGGGVELTAAVALEHIMPAPSWWEWSVCGLSPEGNLPAWRTSEGKWQGAVFALRDDLPGSGWICCCSSFA